MIKLDLQLDGPLVFAMLEMVRASTEALGHRLAVDVQIPEDDEDLSLAWEGELRQALRDDCNYLLGMLDRAASGPSVLELEDDAAESVLRACAAVRLRLRESALRNLVSEELEEGSVSILSLPMEQQHCYACYLFLANLQSGILRQIDPECEEI